MFRIAAACVFALSLTLAPSATAANRCERLPARSHVVETSSFAKVYFTSGGEAVVWKACLQRSGIRYKLVETRNGADASSPGQHVAGSELAGRYVAWVVVRGTQGGPWNTSVEVFDLRKGRTRWVRPGPYKTLGYPPLVTAMTFNRAGRGVVLLNHWQPERPDEQGRPSEARELYAVDAGPARILDSGVGIDPDSVGVVNFTAHWVNRVDPGAPLRYAELY